MAFSSANFTVSGYSSKITFEPKFPIPLNTGGEKGKGCGYGDIFYLENDNAVSNQTITLACTEPRIIPYPASVTVAANTTTSKFTLMYAPDLIGGESATATNTSMSGGYITGTITATMSGIGVTRNIVGVKYWVKKIGG